MSRVPEIGTGDGPGAPNDTGCLSGPFRFERSGIVGEASSLIRARSCSPDAGRRQRRAVRHEGWIPTRRKRFLALAANVNASADDACVSDLAVPDGNGGRRPPRTGAARLAVRRYATALDRDPDSTSAQRAVEAALLARSRAARRWLRRPMAGWRRGCAVAMAKEAIENAPDDGEHRLLRSRIMRDGQRDGQGMIEYRAGAIETSPGPLARLQPGLLLLSK